MRDKKKKRKSDFFDDGRVIAPMGGVYRSAPLSFRSQRASEKREERRKAEEAKFKTRQARNPLNKKEQRMIARSLLSVYLIATLIIFGIFALLMFILQRFWFR